MAKVDEFTLRVRLQGLEIIVGCLRKAPFEVVAPLLNDLQRQINEQEDAAQAQEDADRAALEEAKAIIAAAKSD